MLYDVPTLISYLSQGITLEAGRIIMTGTPKGNKRISLSAIANSGVGYAMKEPQFLKPGDAVEVYIEKIVTLQHRISFE